jgi:hypothetical protein
MENICFVSFVDEGRLQIQNLVIVEYTKFRFLGVKNENCTNKYKQACVRCARGVHDRTRPYTTVHDRTRPCTYTHKFTAIHRSKCLQTSIKRARRENSRRVLQTTVRFFKRPTKTKKIDNVSCSLLIVLKKKRSQEHIQTDTYT